MAEARPTRSTCSCPHRDGQRLQRGPEPRCQLRHEQGGWRHDGFEPLQPDAGRGSEHDPCRRNRVSVRTVDRLLLASRACPVARLDLEFHQRRHEVRAAGRSVEHVVLDRAAPHMLVWSTPGLAVSSPNAQEHPAVFSAMDGRNLDADAIVLARPRTGPVADSILDEVAANLLLSRSQDGAAPASDPALRSTRLAVAPDTTVPSLQLDEDVPSGTSAAGLVAFGLAAGLWATSRGTGILGLRKRQSRSRPSYLASLSNSHQGKR